MTGVHYFLMGEGSRHRNIARVHGHEYSYLDHTAGAWIPYAAVCDAVHFEADTQPITLDRAQRWVKRFVPGIEPTWLDEDGDISA